MKYKPFLQMKECTVNQGGLGQRRWIGTEEAYRDDGLEPGEKFCLRLSWLEPRVPIHLLYPDPPRLTVLYVLQAHDSNVFYYHLSCYLETIIFLFEPRE